MKWEDIGRRVADFAPLLGTALGSPVGGAVGAYIASTFGTAATPDAVDKALLSDPETAAKLRRIEADERVSLQRIAMQRATKEMDALTQQAQAVNETMRAEYAIGDRFKSYWRPIFGYVVAFAFAWIFVVIGVVVIASPWANVSGTVELIAALAPVVIALFGVGLSVLGINIRERTKGKALEHGQQPPAGLMDALASLRK